MSCLRLTFPIIVAALAVGVPQTGTAQQAAPAPPAPVQAPHNPQFQQYLDSVMRGTQATLQNSRGHYLGLIPEPMDLSHLKKLTAWGPSVLTSGRLPASYDLRALGRMTPVRDQGPCGSCWAFATYGSMESALTPAEARDFSENNLKNLDGFDRGACAGGNSTMSMAYLARWAGPVDESADPYDAENSNSPSGLPAQKHVQRAVILPGRGGPLDNSTLKNALINYGALATSMYMDEGSSYNAASSAYYFNGYYPTNHAVTLAGWDDNYSRSNFRTAPPGDGAFLIKNSWGTYWGQGGYFWISYYDGAYAYGNSYAQTGNDAATNYAHKYEYDPLGWIISWGYGNPTAWFANIFNSVATEPLRAVSFYAASNNSSYTVQVYTNANSGPGSGTLQATVSGTVDVAGYTTILVPNAVPLTNGMKFAVTVRLTTPGFEYPIPAEQAIQGYASAVAARAFSNPRMILKQHSVSNAR